MEDSGLLQPEVETTMEHEGAWRIFTQGGAYDSAVGNAAYLWNLKVDTFLIKSKAEQHSMNSMPVMWTNVKNTIGALMGIRVLYDSGNSRSYMDLDTARHLNQNIKNLPEAFVHRS